MRATRAYLAGLGTAGTLVLAASILFVLGSAIVTYNGWPKLGGIGSPATQTLTAHPKSGSHSSRGLASVKVVTAQTGGAAGVPAAVAKLSTLLAQVGQGTVGHTRVHHSSSAAISHPVAARQPTHSSTPTKTGSGTGSGSGGTGSGSTGTGSTGGGTTTVTAPTVPVVATPTPVASTPTTPVSTGSGSGSGGSGSGSGGSGSGSGGSGSGSGGSGSSNPGTPVVKSGSGTVVVTLPARPTGTPVISVTGSSGTSPRVTSTSGSSPSPSSVSSSSGSSSSTSTTTVSSPTSTTSPRVSIPGPVISRTGVSAGGSSSAHVVPGLGNALGGAPHYGSPYGSRACPRGH